MPGDEDVIMDLEEASSPVEEVSIPAEQLNLNEQLCAKFLDLPPPKVSLSRAGVKSACMEQIVILGKIDPLRLNDNPKHNADCFTHECKHFRKSIAMSCKVKGSLTNKGLGGTGSYHVTNAIRHLESHCNEAGLQSMESLLNEKVQNE